MLLVILFELEGVTHSDLIGLWVDWGRGPGRGQGGGLWPGAVQVLDSLPVVPAELQGVGEGVVGRHDGPGLPGVLQPQDVAELMGSHLEEVRAWRAHFHLGHLSKAHINTPMAESTTQGEH